MERDGVSLKKKNEQREARGVSVFILKARSQTFVCY